MSDSEPTSEQPVSADAAQHPRPPSPSHSPSPSHDMASPPDQQPTELGQLQQSQQQQQQGNTALDNPDEPQHELLPPFQPLFTLVTDSTTGATHHAHVHYIFSDDEPDLLTDALGQYSTQHQQYTASSSSGSTSTKPAPPPTIDRAILLDLVPKPSTDSSSSAAPAYDVAWASSLSADWAVVSAKVNPMSADDNDTDVTPARGTDGALMLRIEGVDLAGPPRRTARSRVSLDLSSGSSASAAGQPAQLEDYGAIVDEFDKRMGVLRRVLEAGRERQLKMDVDVDADMEPMEPPRATENPSHVADHVSTSHDQPEDGPSASRRASNGSGGDGQQAGSKRLSGGSAGRAEWEQQQVA